MNFEYILNNIITSGLNLADPDILRKHKVLNVFQLVVIVFLPLFGLFYYNIGAIPLFYTSMAAGILMIGGMVLLRFTRNLVLSGNYALFVLWGAISIISWKTGAISYDGIINPSWTLNAGLILLAIFLNGYLSGTIWATIIFIQTGIVILLFRRGYQFASVIPPDLITTYFMGVYLICLLIILLFAFLFEKEKSDALMREQYKSRTIRESKKYMDNIFDRYPLPTFVLDRRHRVIQWNRACSEISGLSLEEILGKDVWEGFHMYGQGRSMADMILEDIDSISDLYRDEIVSSDRGWFEMNTLLPGLNGAGRVTLTAAPILDDNGIVKGSIQTIQEVKQIPVEGCGQDYLEDWFPKAVFKVGIKGKINFWNSACSDLLGRNSEEMLGKSPLGIVGKNYRPLFKNTFVKVVKGESYTNQEWCYVTAENKPVYVMARVFPSRSLDSDTVECVFINTDVTDLRIKLKRLIQVASESKEKLKGLSGEYDLLKKNIANFVRKKDELPADNEK